MKKKIKMMLLLAMITVAHAAKAQITFTTFKLKPTLLYNVKELHTGFMCDGDKTVKYVKVEWCAVNAVGDVASGSTPGLRLRTASSTGPFKPGKKYKRMGAASFIGMEKVRALPVGISIEYMDGTEWQQNITKDNYQQFFSNVKWIDFDVPGE